MEMTEDQYWEKFLTAIRRETSLFEELTRVTRVDVEFEPSDWTTVYDWVEAAKRLRMTGKQVVELSECGRLQGQMIDGAFMITEAAIKEMLSYDPSKLSSVPWGKVLGRVCPEKYSAVRDNNLEAWVALEAEAHNLFMMVPMGES